MKLLDAETGRIVFADGLCLYGGMPAGEIVARFHNPTQGELTLCLGAHAADGGSLAPVCAVDGGGLRSVTLNVWAAERGGSAERQRAFLFSALGLRDPFPDTRRCVHVGCPFGEMWLYSDPYTGGAAARLTYRENRAFSAHH